MGNGNATAISVTGPPFSSMVEGVQILPKPDVILTHESDLDGLVSGVLLQRLARKLFDIDVPLEAYHYNTWRQREPREAAAWVCDLALVFAQ